jgi:hypothetical protein
MLPEFLAKALLEWKEKNHSNIPYVFHANGQMVQRQHVSKQYNRVLKSLGIDFFDLPPENCTSLI